MTEIKQTNCFLVAVILVLGLCQCAEETGVIASIDSEEITVTDFDNYLLTLPLEQRQMPSGQNLDGWMEAHLRRLAVARILEQTPQMKELESAPETAAMRLNMHITALNSALNQELAAQHMPTAEQITMRIGKMKPQQKPEPLLNFQHIFLRLDMADSSQQRQKIRNEAESIADEAQTGADFDALVRQHSQSSDAATGGLVQNVRIRDLESESAKVLEGLVEGEVSDVVETRTGLHIFRLVRRLVPEQAGIKQLETRTVQSLQQELTQAAIETLLEKLRGRIAVHADQPPWQIGRWVLEQEAINTLLPRQTDNLAAKQALIERLLLAEEAIDRGLETDALLGQIDHRMHQTLLERVFHGHRSDYAAALGEERLLSLYEAQPSRFAEPEQSRLDLIFIPQGSDSFKTQRLVENHIDELRNGASFAELARRISKGPNADQGGDLGVRNTQDWARLGPEIGRAISQLEPGVISDPIYCTGRILTRDPELLRGGFAILRLRERIPGRQRTFEESIDDVRRAYYARHQKDIDKELESQILKKAGFRIIRLPEARELI